MTLTEFLLARIAEDEQAAKAAQGEPSYSHYGDTPAEETLEMALEEGCAKEGAAHFARHMPARVLAECEAKRRTVERHAKCGFGTGYCDDGGHGWYPEGGCGDLADLAAVYADHPDYRDEWKP